MVTHSSILAWKIPWTEEVQGGFHSLAGYSPWGCEELDMTEHTHTHTHTHTFLLELVCVLPAYLSGFESWVFCSLAL